MIQLIIVAVLLGLNLWFKQSVENKSVTLEVSQEKLTSNEKIITWILSITNPILTGLVLYYGWRKRLPIKAKQANYITFWVFLIEIVAGFTIGFMFR